MQDQTLAELNASLGVTSTLTVNDKQLLSSLKTQIDNVNNDLARLKNELDQTNLKILTLTQQINDTYDTQVKRNQALDLLIRKLERQ
jgi:peptidoglycan hydrolase CwlO-like protein